METMRCIWCEKETTTDEKLVNENLKYANKEHIFPESVGGLKWLREGKVCKECNDRLGSKVDAYLKKSNFAFMVQYQQSSILQKKIIGKGRNKEDKIRKQSEIYKIKGYNSDTEIERYDDYNFSLTNLPSGSSGDLTYNDKFSKAIHKCALNVVYNEKGYEYLKTNFQELIDFINNSENQNYNDWAYGITYCDIISYPIHFEPFSLKKMEKDGVISIVVLFFPCAICIVSLKPKLLNTTSFKIVTKNLPRLEHFEKQGYNYFDHVNNDFNNSHRFSFGDKIKFYFIAKQIPGQHNPEDVFHLLTGCKFCGQTNSTGIFISKELILIGDQCNVIVGLKNSWNKYSVNDLKLKGFLVEKWNPESLKKHIENNGISYPIENDVKNLNLSNCEVTCINCKCLITYDAKDCFI